MWKLPFAMAKKGKDDADQAGADDVLAIARGLAQIVTDHHLTELIVETHGTTVTVRRQTAVAMAAPIQMQMPMAAPQQQAAGSSAPAGGPLAVVDDKSHVVTSPFVGTFYRKPNPDSPNYISINDRIEKGAVLCIVEAMKLMNEIEADVSGTVIGILVEDGAPVEYGQALFKIVP